MSGKESRLANVKTLEVSGRGPVSLKVTSVDATTTTLEIGVDYSVAPVPPIHYDSDFCDVLRGRTGLALIFGKLFPGTNKLRTKIEIHFADEHFYRQLWKSSRGLHETLKRNVGEAELPPIAGLEDTEKVQSFRANNVFMAVLGSEAVLDLYYISPGDVHMARNRKKSEIDFEPVVRVVSSSPLLYDFLEKCRPFAASLEEKYGELEK